MKIIYVCPNNQKFHNHIDPIYICVRVIYESESQLVVIPRGFKESNNKTIIQL